MQTIYYSILSQHLSDGFSSQVIKSGINIVTAALNLHQKINSLYLPTAVKFHYIFNLRDLSNIFQVNKLLCFQSEQRPQWPGFTLFKIFLQLKRKYFSKGILFTKPESVRNITELIRVFLHESERVYCDKMVDDYDVNLFFKLQKGVVKKVFEVMLK